jgi:hypothetical protein
MPLSRANFSDGWIAANESWAFATTKYPVGTQIRFKQGAGYKYMTVRSVASTVLTVEGGTDYTVANSAITDNYYSLDPYPVGHPIWYTFAPSVAGGGSMTISSTVINFARTCLIGRVATVQIDTTFTTGGSAATTLNITGLRFTAARLNQAGFLGSITDTSPLGGSIIMDTTTSLEIKKYDNSNYGLGASRRLKVGGSYEV